jgi:tocopherol cyclase
MTMSRNGYMLRGGLARRGYDWWWHSLVGVNKATGEERPFFIEYYVINPALGGKDPIPGQLEENKRNGIKPSYAMLKAGSWGKNGAVQLHNFYGIQDFSASTREMDVKIGPHTATETHLKGAVRMSPEDAAAHPEFMSGAGEMSWDLDARKVFTYHVGFGTSWLFRALNAFQMFWHVQGLKTEYKGSILFNGQEFDVSPDTCRGYQDKNWGADYTRVWVWLNCNNFTSRSSRQKLDMTSLDVGGAQPVCFGINLPRRLLVAFFHEGRLYEFNFSKILLNPKQRFDCKITEEKGLWDITAWNRNAKIEISFSCPLDHMMLFNYENPDGQKNHTQLWNGHHASGTVKLYRKAGGDYELIDTFDGRMGGCEFGEY